MTNRFLRSTLISLLLAAINSPVYAGAPTQNPAKIRDLVDIIENIIKLLAPAAAIAFLIMLLIGGFKFVSSGGDPKATASAKATLTYAVIGVILVVVAWLILSAISYFTTANVTDVKLPAP